MKDLTKYDELMEGLVDQGINRIDNVTFESSKLAQYESEARKLAIKDAKSKAEDYVSVLGQKVGKAIVISDNSQGYRPQPIYAAMKSMAMDSAGAASNETLAIGEIEIVSNVSVSFILE
ncbi:SIMPL domain-containing protein [Flavobacterium sp. 140616W15]|uniref:SIMPL domain-containing protein n=1 Tax=Flavobacterium sp. 140616W15 TaxID=2478552 RepID=UPI0026C19061